MCCHPRGVLCQISHDINGERSRTTSPSSVMMLSGVTRTAYGGTKSIPMFGAIYTPSGAYLPSLFNSGDRVLPRMEPCTSTIVRSAESRMFLNGPSICERSLTVIT